MRPLTETLELALVLLFIGAPRLQAISSTDEAKTVSTLATVPLGVLFTDNSYSPVASFRGTTYFVWIHSDNRPKVGMVRGGVLSSSYLSPNSAYTIRNDGHHYFSLGVDKAGYLHVTGDMHNYPATDMTLYPAEYRGKNIMYWVSHSPESVSSFDFVGGDAPRCMPGYGFSYHSFQYDQDRELYFISRIKVHKAGHVGGEMGLGLFRYDTAAKSWTALGGLAPSSPAAIYKSIIWENNGESDNGGWYQGFRASCRFDFSNRLHFAATIVNDSSKPDPTHVLYGRSDDRGLSFKKADGSPAVPPLRVDPGAMQGDIVAGPGKYDLFASVAANRQGAPLAGYSELLDHLTFSYKYREAAAWSPTKTDPFGTYIRAKYQTDANGILTFLAPTGQFRRAEDFASAAYNGSVGLNSSFVGVDELGLRENNEFIGLSKGSGQVLVAKLKLQPALAALPAPWALADLGSPSSTLGGHFYGVISLGSASSGLAGASDSGRFAWQAASGDFDLKVRVLSLAWSDDSAQAGLLVRDSGSAGSAMAASLITYDEGAQFVSRAALNVAAASTVKAGHTAAEWLRLTRVGSLISAYRSDDGSAWQLIGSKALTLGATVQAGLFQASGAPGVQGQARFDHFSLISSPASTATRTRTPAPLPSSTSTPTFSPTPSSSRTRSATPTDTRTRTPTPSSTRSQTLASSATYTSTRSTTPTTTATPSLSPPATQAESPSASPSTSRTAMPLGSPSATAELSPSPTTTSSGTSSPTRTSSPSFTRTSTPSSTFSATRTRTATASLTRSPSMTRTRSSTPTASKTATPRPPATRTATPAPTSPVNVEVFHQSTDSAAANGPHHKIQLKNKGATALALADLEIRYWLDCDCGNEAMQAFVDWAGFPGSGATIPATASLSAFSGSGQTHYVSLKFGSGSLAPGASVEVQFRFNRASWGAMDQGDDYSWGLHSSLVSWPKATAYYKGVKVWGTPPAPLGLAKGSWECGKDLLEAI